MATLRKQDLAAIEARLSADPELLRAIEARADVINRGPRPMRVGRGKAMAEHGIEFPDAGDYRIEVDPVTGQVKLHRQNFFQRNMDWIAPVGTIGGAAAVGALAGGAASAAGGASAAGVPAATAPAAAGAGASAAAGIGRQAAQGAANASGMNISEMMKLMLLQGGLGTLGSLIGPKEQERQSFKGTGADPAAMLSGASDAIKGFQAPMMSRLKSPNTIPGASAPTQSYGGFGVQGDVAPRTGQAIAADADPFSQAQAALNLFKMGKR